MLCQIVGVGSVFNYKDKKTQEDRRARNLFIVRQPSPNESGYTGLVAESVFLPEAQFSLIPVDGFSEKKQYDLIYDYDGRRSFLKAIQEV